MANARLQAANASSLYELTDALEAAIDGCYTVDDDGVVAWSPDDLDALEMAVADKVLGCAGYAQKYNDLAALTRARIDELRDLARYYESRAKRVEEYAVKCVEKIGSPIESGTARVSVRKTKVVQVLDDAAIPKSFRKVHIRETSTPDKIKIRNAILKDGVEVPGCAVVENKHLVVM